MVLYEDTRQQAGKHENIHKYCEKHGIRIVRSKAAEKGLALQLNIYLESALGAGLVLLILVLFRMRSVILSSISVSPLLSF